MRPLQGLPLRFLRATAIALGLSWLAAFGYLSWLGVDVAVNVPDPPGYPRSDVDYWVTTAHGDLACRFFANPEAETTIVYAHGSAVDIGETAYLFEMHRDRGYNVVAFDYPGFGHSSGEVSVAGIQDSMVAVVADTLARHEIPENQIILLGRSLGSHPALHAAIEFPQAQLILISPFTSTHELLAPVDIFPGELFNNMPLVRRIEKPFHIVHGEADTAVPAEHGRRLADQNLQTVFTLIPGAGHGDIHHAAQYWGILTDSTVADNRSTVGL